MFKIYKKCEKSVDNPYGILEISNINEITKPFLLCIAPRINEYNSTFGIKHLSLTSIKYKTHCLNILIIFFSKSSFPFE